MPIRIVNELVKLLNEPFGNFIMLILSACETNLELRDHSLEMLSFKLDSDCVVVEQDNAMMKIEKRNRSNNGSTSIALLAAQFLLKAFEDLNSMVTFLSYVFDLKF